jgi:peptide/nickel transport system substrate-binding protein
MGYERPLPKSIELNLAESYRFEEGGKAAVFKIRKGIRWSDGVPFTVDDVLFWYYDMILDGNARSTSSPPSIWMVDGEAIGMKKVDDYTLVRMTCIVGDLLHRLIHWATLLCGAS